MWWWWWREDNRNVVVVEENIWRWSMWCRSGVDVDQCRVDVLEGK